MNNHRQYGLLRPFLILIVAGLARLPAQAQQPQFAVRSLRLPPELAYYDNQFSGLATGAGQLYLLSESRLQDQAEAKLYAVPLADLDRQLADSTRALSYRKLPIRHLAALRARLARLGQSYEGLEAILLDHETVYLTVETATPSTNCYLLKGRLQAQAVALDTTFLVALPKPVAADGAHIYNAGFEALAAAGKQLFAFFEYNSFAGPNYVYELAPGAGTPSQRPLASLPFRLTDLTATGNHHWTGINYFFKGDGPDAVYRPAAADTLASRLVAGPGGVQNYCRLIDVVEQNGAFSWRPLWEFPVPYRGYNWEGLAAYNGGYFLINDKYTPTRPYQTTLRYLQRVP